MALPNTPRARAALLRAAVVRAALALALAGALVAAASAGAGAVEPPATCGKIFNCATLTLAPPTAVDTGSARVTSVPEGIDCTIAAGGWSGTCSSELRWVNGSASLDVVLTITPSAGTAVCEADVCGPAGEPRSRTVTLRAGETVTPETGWVAHDMADPGPSQGPPPPFTIQSPAPAPPVPSPTLPPVPPLTPRPPTPLPRARPRRRAHLVLPRVTWQKPSVAHIMPGAGAIWLRVHSSPAADLSIVPGPLLYVTSGSSRQQQIRFAPLRLSRTGDGVIVLPVPVAKRSDLLAVRAMSLSSLAVTATVRSTGASRRFTRTRIAIDQSPAKVPHSLARLKAAVDAVAAPSAAP
jgi:hypothetical protein